MVTIKTPATSANLGPGFDCLGIALKLYNTISFEEEGTCLFITGCEKEYCNENNLCYVSYLKCLEYANIEKPKGLKINIKASIPISRGLGSSSSLLVSGIMAANEIHKLNLSKNEMLNLACKIEGHPDNVTPALFGGLTASIMEKDNVFFYHYPVSKDLIFTLLIPDFECSTEYAREILPKMIDRKDAIYNLSRLPIQLKALELGDEEALMYSISDKLHEPYRKALIIDYDIIKEITKSLGATSLVISGAGSTLLTISKKSIKDELNIKINEEYINNKVTAKWEVIELGIDLNGALII